MNKSAKKIEFHTFCKEKGAKYVVSDTKGKCFMLKHEKVRKKSGFTHLARKRAVSDTKGMCFMMKHVKIPQKNRDSHIWQGKGR